MGKCVKCGTNFVGTPETPAPDGLCKYCEIEQLRIALHESLKLQAHYAKLLNDYDGGNRMIFDTIQEWTRATP